MWISFKYSSKFKLSEIHDLIIFFYLVNNIRNVILISQSATYYMFSFFFNASYTPIEFYSNSLYILLF